MTGYIEVTDEIKGYKPKGAKFYKNDIHLVCILENGDKFISQNGCFNFEKLP